MRTWRELDAVNGEGDGDGDGEMEKLEAVDSFRSFERFVRYVCRALYASVSVQNSLRV
jgi:hypothetical protein